MLAYSATFLMLLASAPPTPYRFAPPVIGARPVLPSAGSPETVVVQQDSKSVSRVQGKRSFNRSTGNHRLDRTKRALEPILHGNEQI